MFNDNDDVIYIKLRQTMRRRYNVVGAMRCDDPTTTTISLNSCMYENVSLIHSIK